MPQTRYISWTPSPDSIKRIGKIHTWLFRTTNGIIGSRLDGLDVLLLTTTGAKTGQPRSVPVPYFRDGTRYLLIGSFGGSAKHPAWITNVMKNPEVEVQVRARRWKTRARIAQGEERSRLYGQISHEFPRYAVYQTRTERAIPVLILESEDTPRAQVEAQPSV